MAGYVDGFLLPVPDNKLETYREIAAEAGKLWIKHGALEYFEGVGDDLSPDLGGVSIRTFPTVAEAGEDESVVFSFIVYESREHRDEVNAKVVEDPAMEQMGHDEEMPFEFERMAQGGFRSIVSYED